MGKIKPPRKNPSLDMTAMCDMAFLLLTFFILTAQFKPETPLEVDAPSSSSNKEETPKVAKIIVDTAGRVFFEIKEANKREEILRGMARHYKIADQLTDEDYKEFAGRQSIGVSMQDLPKVLKNKAVSNEAYKKLKVKIGIPLDSNNNQLGHWILYTNKIYETETFNRRQAMDEKTKAIVTKPSPEGLSEAEKKIWEEEQKQMLKIVIFGDQRAKFEIIKRVLEVLQQRKINKVHLVTNLREAPAGAANQQTQKKN